jgi:hypothetical protein
MRFLILVSFLLLFPFSQTELNAQAHTVDNFCISRSEERLVEFINALRKQNRMPEIALSASLSFVAKTHIADLQRNRPDTSICSTASWSDQGIWTACCYQGYVLKNECMWDKPKELTPYTFRGYELSYYDEGIIEVDKLWELWLSTEEVVDMFLTRGKHTDKKWAAVGVGISDNFASVWFGQRADAKGKPRVCSESDVAFRAPFKDSRQISSTAEATETSKFFLIYGSFAVRADAEEALRRYKNAGFRNAQIVTKEKRIRVALDVFPTLREAMFAKEKLSASYGDAWIMRE